MQQNYMSAVTVAQAALRSWIKSSPFSPSQSSSSPSKKEGTDRPSTVRTPPPPPPHLILTSSVLAYLPLTGYSAYTPTKSALRSLAETLSQEILLFPPSTLRPKISCISPATIHSPGFAHEQTLKPAVTKKCEEGDAGQTCDEAAAEAVRELESGKSMGTTGGWIAWVLKVGAVGAGRRVWWEGVVSGVLGWILWGVRWDMDRTVEKWGMAAKGA